MEIEPLQSILQDHIRRYPAMEARDLYKLLHEATHGSAHAVHDADQARKWLERELAGMGPGLDEPWIDPISPDQQIVRVHLRPSLQAGCDQEALLQAFVRTANEWRGPKEDLGEYGEAAAAWADSNPGLLTGDAVRSFFAEMEALGYPAVHHSETFRSLYSPAYRVVARAFYKGC